MKKRAFVIDPEKTFDPTASRLEEETKARDARARDDGESRPGTAAEPEAAGGCCGDKPTPPAASPRSEGGCC